MQADELGLRAEPGAATGTAKRIRPQQEPAAGASGPQPVPDGPLAGGEDPAAEDTGAARPARPARPDRVPWLIALGVFAAYTTLSVFRYWQLGPGSWDLGIFTEYVRQYASLHAPVVDIKGAGFNLLGDHFHPIVALIAPFFRLFPTPVTLLVAQAALAAASLVPVSRAAAASLGIGAGRVIGAAYGLSWGLQQMVDNDFHEIAFAVPLLACSLSALICGRRRAAALWALPLVFVKEDQGLTVAAIGVVMIMLARRKARMASGPAGDAGGLQAGAQAADGLEAGAQAERGHDTASHDADGPDPGAQAAGGLVAGAQAECGHDTASHDADGPDPGARDADGPDTGARDADGPDPGARDAGAPRRDLWGPLLIAWGLGWSFLAVAVIIPHFNPAHSYQYWSMGGAVSAGGHFALSPLAGQLFAAASVKLPTLAMILLVTGFIAVRSPIALVAIPSLLLRFISTNSAYWGTAWHYNATVMPIVFIAAVDGLARIGAARRQGKASRAGLVLERHGAAVMLAICAALAFQFPLSNLWNPQTYAISRQARAADAAMARVPDGVTVETDLDLLAPLAARTDTFWLGTAGNPPPQYIVFDSYSTDWRPPPANIPEFIDQRHPGVSYRLTFFDDRVYVFRRIGPPGR